MTLYGLLGKIYNRNDDMPKKIRIFGDEFEYKDEDYYSIHSSAPLISYLGEDYLCDELKYNVEIIEEKKIPEKLDVLVEVMSSDKIGALTDEVSEIQRRFNQLIDYLKNKGE